MTVKVDTDKTQPFQQALETLESAFSYAKSMYQPDVLQAAAKIMNDEKGMTYLYSYAKRFDESGLFEGGPWNEPSTLQPELVTGSLMASGMTSIVEILSELRMVSLAKGEHKHDKVSQDEANQFLNEVMALNVDILFPEETEASRIEGKGKEKDRAEHLFQFLSAELSLASISGTLLKEIDELVAQRPIMVDRITMMIKNAKPLLDTDIEKKDRQAIQSYLDALSGTSKLAKEDEDIPLSKYREQLQKASTDQLKEESKTFAKSMRKTGLVSPLHVILVRFLNVNKPELLPEALGLNKQGKASLEEHDSIVGTLIKLAIHPPMRQSLYGLACLLERGVLSSNPIIPGLRRLIELDLQPDVRKVLLNSIKKGNEGITANNIMIAGVISVLGQPLGVGQGMNPTCQTARGISLWSLHATDYLLEIIARAARDGDIDIQFEGQRIHSKNLHEGLVNELHENLDPVSLILVPHLDRIYGELVRRAEFRGDDVHKWVNPAFYGSWVPNGFSSLIDPLLGTIADYSGFVRLFYATHHPEFNNDYELIYPNPVGIFITNSFGDLLGLHAISIQRIAKDKSETYRIYFYNPNNDGSQDWGQDIKPTVTEHRELPGESSLPFPEFVSRLYAFHYNPHEQGDAFALDDNIVKEIETKAQESWGEQYTWVDL